MGCRMATGAPNHCCVHPPAVPVDPPAVPPAAGLLQLAIPPVAPALSYNRYALQKLGTDGKNRMIDAFIHPFLELIRAQATLGNTECCWKPFVDNVGGDRANPHAITMEDIRGRVQALCDGCMVTMRDSRVEIDGRIVLRDIIKVDWS